MLLNLIEQQQIEIRIATEQKATFATRKEPSQGLTRITDVADLWDDLA
jgi:hypothetical protein